MILLNFGQTINISILKVNGVIQGMTIILVLTIPEIRFLITF